MTYTFRVGPELLWLLLTTVVITIAQTLIIFEPSEISDWRLWAIGLAGAVVRAVAGAVIAAGSGGFVASGEADKRP